MNANAIDREFVARVEKAHFRSAGDTGANPNAMMVWNLVRAHVGLERITLDQLPRYCVTHAMYHRILPEYGCRDRIQSKQDSINLGTILPGKETI